jgi:hypothetical protein
MNTCHILLRHEGFQLPDSGWSCLSVPQLLRDLLDLGAHVGKSFWWGGNVITYLMWCMKNQLSTNQTFVEMISVLIEHGADINDTDGFRMSPSMFARHQNCWAEWCRALKHNGLQIEDVLEKEGNTWLLKSDWQKVWRERRYQDWDELDSTDDENELYSISSDVETISEDGEEEEAHGEESDFPEDITPGTILSANTYIESSDEASRRHATEHINDIISSEIVAMLAYSAATPDTSSEPARPQ